MCRPSYFSILYNQWNDCIIDGISFCGILLSYSKSRIFVYLYILYLWWAASLDCWMEPKFKIWWLCSVPFKRIFKLFHVFFQIDWAPTSSLVELIKIFWNSGCFTYCGIFYYILHCNLKPRLWIRRKVFKFCNITKTCYIGDYFGIWIVQFWLK